MSLLLFGAALLASAPAGAAEPASAEAPEPTVILLSWDGVRHDYPDRDAKQLPSLSRMAREGARAEALVPVFPSLTFPSHVSLATGAPVDRHGMVANRFWDRERGEFDYGADANWIDAEPLWIAAERQGVRAASFFWVGSETDWRGRGASYRRTPFSSRTGEAEKVRQILEWLDLPESERPRLILSWWHGADHAGHRYGPDADETRDQLREQDGHLGRLLAALDERGSWDHTTLLVVSDHGMTAVRRGLDTEAVLGRAGIEARVMGSTAFAHVFLEDPADLSRATALFEGRRGVRVFPGHSVPRELRYAHPTRMGDLVILLDPPLELGGRKSGFIGMLHQLFGPFMRARGGHGYDPSHPDMHGVLYAMGRGTTPGTRLPRQRAIDIAATVSALLGIEAPLQSEGRAIEGLGAD